MLTKEEILKLLKEKDICITKGEDGYWLNINAPSKNSASIHLDVPISCIIKDVVDEVAIILPKTVYVHCPICKGKGHIEEE